MIRTVSLEFASACPHNKLMGKLSDYHVMIRELHLDFMGHVNNATYLELFEEARWQVIFERGYGLADIKRLGQGPVILEVNLKYLKEITLRDKIRITVELLDYEGKIGHLKQCMIKENGECAAEAIFKFGLFDLNSRKLIMPTPEWRHALAMDADKS